MSLAVVVLSQLFTLLLSPSGVRRRRALVLTSSMVLWFWFYAAPAPVFAQSDSMPLRDEQYSALMKIYNATGLSINH